MIESPSPQNTVYLKDYTKAPFHISHTHLHFYLQASSTEVVARSKVRRQIEQASDLVLEGESINLHEISINGVLLNKEQYDIRNNQLHIKQPPAEFTLEIKNTINPEANSALSGLYISSGVFCTQCEAEGFRRITYFLDRPDNLAVYDVTLQADKSAYPILLANGNPQEQGENEDGTHWAHWHDPHPKPSYLFAIVAGDLQCIRDEYTTQSGNRVQLNIFTEAHNITQCDFAMQSLKKAMQWDEQHYNREYDLSVYNIVAVDDFNMGAMENKGLNVFNTKYVLANKDTATDEDYSLVEAVIAHEYFHNWSGNRVTCRDWFQLSLKEGFTVFREQQFCADMGSETVNRIRDVQRLRSLQFKEDAGPMAHAVRPISYQQINNFYTTTIYEKGAEVIRMMQSIVGAEDFRKGCDFYFKEYDGQAVTTEEFITSIEQVSQRDLTQFRLWYTQAGTPHIQITSHFDASQAQLSVICEQTCPATPGQPKKQPMVIPIAMALFAQTGEKLHAETLILDKQKQVFTFENIAHRPVVSLLRWFSAPIKMQVNQSMQDAAHLVRYETDGFARFEAMQTCMLGVITPLLHGEGIHEENYALLSTLFTKILSVKRADNSLRSELMRLPSAQYLYELYPHAEPEKIVSCLQRIKATLAHDLEKELLAAYTAAKQGEPNESQRALMNTVLDYLMYAANQKHHHLAHTQYAKASNMTNRYAAMQSLVLSGSQYSSKVLLDFYKQWKDYPLLVNKWFLLQASVPEKNSLHTVQTLLKHPQFSLHNPNNVYALLLGFANNISGFHQQDGAAYRWYADRVIQLDAINPQIAARLVSVFNTWQDKAPSLRVKMQQQLSRIYSQAHLSSDVNEIVGKALA